MKTKHILFGLSLQLGLMVAFTSCDVTDLSPLDSITDESFWNTTNDLEAYATGFYENLGEPDNTLDYRSDDRLTTTPDEWLWDEYTLPADADDTDWNWENIRDLNYFMARYDQVDGSESEINQWVAVIRFFRALDYFSKIKTFGDVPWYDVDLTTADTEELYKARDDRFYVLSKIIEDLEYAIEWLPEKSSAETCALHKDAARVQLARVCLHYGTYMKYHSVSSSYYTYSELLQQAADLAEEIMDSGDYAIVQAADNGSNQSSFDGYPLYYSNLFTMEDMSSCSEAILYQEYEDNVLMHNLARSTYQGFSKDFAETFLCTDGQPISVSDLYQGDNTIDDEFTNRDPRMYQIMDSKFRPYTLTSSGNRIINVGYSETNTYPSGTDPDFTSVHSAPEVTTYSGYNQIKFKTADQAQADAAWSSTYDWIVYRYAEVLLIRAEAEAELGTFTQSICDETINALRDRVGMPHLDITDVPTDVSEVRSKYYPTVSDLIYEIRRERRIELAAEGFRYDDVMRWNALSVYENPKTYVGIVFSDDQMSLYESTTRSGITLSDGTTYLQIYSGKSEGDASRVWDSDDKRLFYPIPTNEITIYAAAGYTLEQNPGW